MHGCQKCVVIGKYSHISNTVVFTKSNMDPRTDADFRARKYPLHQLHSTALTQLPIDLINDVVVGDELHLLELGVVKRLIVGWRTGSLGLVTKWSLDDISNISNILIKIDMPSETHRDIRSLKLFAHWKGVEFRNFLLYYGFVVLQDFLPKQNYIHFLQLFAATTICSTRAYFHHLNVAQILFQQFVNDYKRLYGPQFITSNIHNLTHVVDEVKRFGELATFSAYPFENYLGVMKRIIKGGKNALTQISRRLTERLFITDYNYKPINPNKNDHISIVVKGSGQIRINLEKFMLRNDQFKDKWFSTKTNKVMCMQRAFKKDNDYYVTAFSVEQVVDHFSEPFNSSLLNIFRANISDIKNGTSQTFPISDITFKFAAIVHQNYCVFIPLLHTLIK